MAKSPVPSGQQHPTLSHGRALRKTNTFLSENTYAAPSWPFKAPPTEVIHLVCLLLPLPSQLPKLWCGFYRCCLLLFSVTPLSLLPMFFQSLTFVILICLRRLRRWLYCTDIQQNVRLHQPFLLFVHFLRHELRPKTRLMWHCQSSTNRVHHCKCHHATPVSYISQYTSYTAPLPSAWDASWPMLQSAVCLSVILKPRRS